MRTHCLSLLSALIACSLSAGRLLGQAPPTRAELDAITARGRMLAAYDRAAWLGSDAVLALSTEGITHYIARKTSTEWIVSFGKLTANADTFLVAIETWPVDGAPHYEARAFSPPRADVDYLTRAARAINASVDALGSVSRAYNVAVLPEPSGAWWVYLYPASTVMGVWPHGSDVRYRVSRDGRRILEERRLHKEVIEYGPPPESTKSGVHTAVMADIVEDTDVLLVITRQPPMPELVISRSFLFTIDIDGQIICTIRQ
jgi:hypothetical protein